MKITIQKYDPSLDAAPHDEEYEVPYKEHMTLLMALVYIDENYDNLAFDLSCRGRTCGRCGVMLDGVAVTACTKGLTDESHKVEPLKGCPVIRDLVVDKSELQNKAVRAGQRITSKLYSWEDVKGSVVDPKAGAVLTSVDRCANCMICTVNCPVYQSNPADYAGPAVMAQIAMRYCDPFDSGDRIAQAVSNGLWNCAMCGNCDEVCHCYEIDHMGMWQMLRDAATERGLTDNIGSALSFGDK